jgi:hypothetical protein
MTANAHVDATVVETRRVELLRLIAHSGGRISPVADPQVKHGYRYEAPGGDVENDLAVLSRQNYLEARFFDRVSLCPKCDGCQLNVREICPSCHSAHLSSEGLFHHFRCGYVGIPPEFSAEGDGGFRCPKCNHAMHHLGTEYDRLGKAFVCRGCGVVSETPPDRGGLPLLRRANAGGEFGQRRRLHLSDQFTRGGSRPALPLVRRRRRARSYCRRGCLSATDHS